MVFTVEGVLPRKSNRRRVVKRGDGKAMVIKSAEALGYEEHFLAVVLEMVRELQALGVCPLHTFLAVQVVVWYPTDARDLDIELLLDLLQRSGVIENDNQVRVVEGVKAFCDGEEPRVQVVVTGVMATYEVRKAGL